MTTTRRPLLALVVSLALAAVPVPIAAAEEGKSPDNCGAITVEERPPIGDGTDGFDWSRYQRAHDVYLPRHPDVFASGYLSGNHFYVGFTKRVCHHLAAMRRMVEQGWRFRAFVANHSYRELRSAQSCVDGIAHRHRLGISAWGPDTWRNKLWVMLRKRNERRERIIRHECPEVGIFFTEGSVEPV